MHGEISGLLERTRKQRDQALTAGATADPKAAAEATRVEEPVELERVADRQ